MSDKPSEQESGDVSLPPAGPSVVQGLVGGEPAVTSRPSQSLPRQEIWPPPPVSAYQPPPGQSNASVNGAATLILGILSIAVCSICGPIAWTIGNQALATLNQNGDPLNQRTMVNAGRICGIVGTVFLGLSVLYYIGILAFGFMGSRR